MRCVIGIISVLFLLLFFSVHSIADTVYSFDYSEENLVSPGDGTLEDLKNRLPEEVESILPEGWETEETPSFRLGDLFGQVLGGLKDNLLPTFGNAAKLLSVLLIAAIFYGFRDTLSGDTIKTALELAVVAGSTLAILEIELSVLRMAESYISSVCGVMNTLLPIMGGVCLSVGASAMAAVTNVEMMAFAAISGNLFSVIVLPLSSMCLALASASNLGSTKLRSLIKSLNWIASTVIALLLMGFAAFLAAQTKLAASADSLRIQGVKFAVSSFIPLVGGALSDALGTLSASFSVIKSSVGAVGIVVVVLMTLPILFNLLLNRFVLFVGKSAADLLGCTRETAFLEDVGSVFTFITAVVSMISVLFVILLALCVNTVVGVRA